MRAVIPLSNLLWARHRHRAFHWSHPQRPQPIRATVRRPTAKMGTVIALG